MEGESSRPSVLVGLLHVGEPSVPRVRDRIGAQRDVDVELVEFSHLPEREAHARLYAAFDGPDARHDALVKVDADMELVEPFLLSAIATMFTRHPGLDHMMIGVDDWFSGQRIQGMTAWRNGIRWTSPPPELFTDLPTNTARTKLALLDVGRPLVLHATDPTDEQAVRYGLHRGLKAVATGKASRMARLLDVVDHAGAKPAHGRMLAVAAIGLAFEDPAAARRLLDAAGSESDALARLVERAGSPEIVERVRARIAAAAASPDAPTSPDGLSTDGTPLGRRVTTGVRAVARRVRGSLRRMRGEGLPGRDELRSEFLALLEQQRTGDGGPGPRPGG